MRIPIRSSPRPRLRRSSLPIRSCGAIGHVCRKQAMWASMIAAGMAASSSSVLKDSRVPPSGRVLMTRSTSSNALWSNGVRSCSNSGWISLPKHSSSVLRRARTIPISNGRSPLKTGAIAIVILNIMQPFRICSVLPRLLKHRGLSLRAMTSFMRASKRSRPSTRRLKSA